MRRNKLFYIYLSMAIILLSCNEDKEPIPEEPLGQVRLNLISDKDVKGEKFDLSILDNSGKTIESITNTSEPPEYIKLEKGAYKISISSQNKEFNNFGDIVFSGVSDLFEISRSDTLEVSVNLNFDQPLGQVKIKLSGVDYENEFFTLYTLDNDSILVETQSDLQNVSPYIALETGSYQYAVQSRLRDYITVEDLVFSGYSQGFSIEKGDTLLVNINLSLDNRHGWISVPNVPIRERYASSSFIIGNKVYIGFGSSFSNGIFQDWWVYSIETNTWRQLANFPEGKRFSSLSFTIGNYGYVCLGHAENNSYLLELWEFNSDTESWSQLTDFPGSPRSSPTAFVIGDKAYVGSGISNGITSLNDFYEYDQANNQWTKISDFNGVATYGFTSFAIGNTGHLMAGVINNDERTKRQIVFNSTNETWSELPLFPGAERLNGLGFTIDGKGYFGLGSITNNKAGTDLWVYNPSDATWQETDRFVGEPRFSAIHGSNGSVGYFGFGLKGNNQYKDLYLYYPSN